MIIRETSRYSVNIDRHGFVTITRKADGADVFMQGDDAAALEADLGDLAATPRDELFDWYLSEYDHVMEVRA